MGSLPSPPPRPRAPPRTPENSPPTNQLIYCAFWFRDREPPSLTMSIKIFSYHPSNNTWNFVTSMPGLSESHVLKDFAMVALGESLYIIGGRSFRQRRACEGVDDRDDDGRVVAAVRRYGLRSAEWSSCAPLATPRYDFACTVCGGKIYVAGGKATLASPTGLASAEVYDPALDAWSPLPSMSTRRYKCAGVTWHGKVHVVGGFALKAGMDSEPPLSFAPERSSAEVFDGQKREWDLAAGMWQLDVPPNQIVAVDDGRLLSSGDCLKAWKGHIESYDWVQNIWNEVEGSQLESLNWPVCDDSDDRALVQQLYLTIAHVGTFLYFLVGYQVGGETPRTKSVVHRYDTSAMPMTNPWVSFEPMEEEGLKMLCSHCCVAQV